MNNCDAIHSKDLWVLKLILLLRSFFCDKLKMAISPHITSLHWSMLSRNESCAILSTVKATLISLVLDCFSTRLFVSFLRFPVFTSMVILRYVSDLSILHKWNGCFPPVLYMCSKTYFFPLCFHGYKTRHIIIAIPLNHHRLPMIFSFMRYDENIQLYDGYFCYCKTFMTFCWYEILL